MADVVNQKITDEYALYNADTCAAILDIPDNSCGFGVFSSPFRELYCYSNLLEDMGNSKACQFDDHYEFLIPHLLRITKPGRNLSFHCMNIPKSKGKDGVIGLTDFRGQMIKLFEKYGWIFHGEVCIWKDPVLQMQRTKALGLLHKQTKKDSCMSRQGLPDYLITMRKPGINESPVAHEHGFTEYAGTNPPDCDGEMWVWAGTGGKKRRPKGWFEVKQYNGEWPKLNPFKAGSEAHESWSIVTWQRYASPVWMDIQMSGDVAGIEGRKATLQSMREEEDIKHICPLQLQVIERAIHLWSNPEDTVFTPFLGIGSEVYESVRLGRKGIGIELKTAYFEQAIKNMHRLACQMSEKELF